MLCFVGFNAKSTPFKVIYSLCQFILDIPCLHNKCIPRFYCKRLTGFHLNQRRASNDLRNNPLIKSRDRSRLYPGSNPEQILRFQCSNVNKLTINPFPYVWKRTRTILHQKMENKISLNPLLSLVKTQKLAFLQSLASKYTRP